MSREAHLTFITATLEFVYALIVKSQVLFNDALKTDPMGTTPVEQPTVSTTAEPQTE
ncbi:MAG: hypothetical protein QXT13_13025 [Pyrobaculum sp.]